jgi:hypothetical protein
MIGDLGLFDESFLQQGLDVAMVPTAFLYSLATQVINAAVADMTPERQLVLNQTRCAGCARSCFDSDIFAQFNEGIVRLAYSQVQKSLRIKDWAARSIEFLSDNFAGQLSGTRTVRVSPHTIYGQDQARGIAGSYDYSILVFLAIT